MEKQTSANPFTTNTNSNNVPVMDPGTSTSSGVTVFRGSIENNNRPPPPPPTYDQAMGNAQPSANKSARSFSTSNAWTAPGMGPANTCYNIPTSHSTTTYTTYATTVPPQRTAFAQPPVVIIQQPPIMALGPEPVYMTCPACNIQKLTRIEHQPNSKTHLMAALFCLVGLWCCFCIPYCAGSCMSTNHYCGNCGKFLGTYGNTL